MPATCRSAADVSAKGQRRTKLLVRIELLALIGAGVAGLYSLRVGPAQLDVLAALAGVLFLLSLTSLVYRGLTTPKESWYAGRAGAESMRTSAWRELPPVARSACYLAGAGSASSAGVAG